MFCCTKNTTNCVYALAALLSVYEHNWQWSDLLHSYHNRYTFDRSLNIYSKIIITQTVAGACKSWWTTCRWPYFKLMVYKPVGLNMLLNAFTNLVDHSPQKCILHPWHQWESICLHQRLHFWNSDKRVCVMQHNHKGTDSPMNKVQFYHPGQPTKNYIYLFKHGYTILVTNSPVHWKEQCGT